MNEKKEELQGLKKASSEKEAELLSEVRRLKEQSLRDKAELEKAVERAKEVTHTHWEAELDSDPHTECLSRPLVSAVRKDGGRPRDEPGAAGSKRPPQRAAGPHGTSHTAADMSSNPVTQKTRPHTLY